MTEVNTLFFSILGILMMATGVAVDEETGRCKSVIWERTIGLSMSVAGQWGQLFWVSYVINPLEQGGG